jgi:predicted GTPase
LIQTVEFNEQFSKALDLMESTDKNVLIVGRAGTGKSTLLNYFRNNTKKKNSSFSTYRRCGS